MSTVDTPVDWSTLAYSSRMALIRAAELLSAGFTGRIEMECAEGGVRSIEQRRRETADDIEKSMNGDGER